VIAKIIPQLIAAGNAGGTAITIRFKDLSIKVAGSDLFLIREGIIAKKPTTAIKAMIKTNFIPSL
jgi:hypothetical protein